jgi:hypothetical protein
LALVERLYYASSSSAFSCSVLLFPDSINDHPPGGIRKRQNVLGNFVFAIVLLSKRLRTFKLKIEIFFNRTIYESAAAPSFGDPCEKNICPFHFLIFEISWQLWLPRKLGSRELQRRAPMIIDVPDADAFQIASVNLLNLA